MQYEIVEKYGCTVVYGPISVSKMCKLLTLAGAEEEVSPVLATRLGATMVIGTSQNLKKLAEDPVTIATARSRVEELRGDFPLPEKAIRWLEQGERGLSSESMFRCFTGFPGLERGNYPRDISDFRRCRLLMEQVPEFFADFHRLQGISVVWSRLVAAWSEICQKMDEEWPDWRSGEIEKYGNTPVMASNLLKAALGETLLHEGK